MNFVRDPREREESRRYGDGDRRMHLAPPRETVMPPLPEARGGEIDVREIFLQIYNRKWFVLAVVLLGILAGAILGQLPANVYQAKSLVQIEQRDTGPVLPAELIGELFSGALNESDLETEFHVIKSRLILDPVVEELDLDLIVQGRLAPVVGNVIRRHDMEKFPLLDGLIPERYVRRGDSITVGAFVVENSLLEEMFSVEILDDSRYRISPLSERLEGVIPPAEGRVGEPLNIADRIELTLAGIDAPPGREFVLGRVPVRVAAEGIARSLDVEGRDYTEVVDFSYTSTDGPQAIDVVNAVVASYRNQNLRRRSAEIDQTISFIEAELPDVAASVEEAEARLRNYQDERNPEQLSLGTQALLEQAVRLESSLRDFEYREEILLGRVTEDQPDLQSLRTGKAQILERLDEIREDLAAIPVAERELAALVEEVERARELEMQLLARVEQLRILKASTVANIRVLEPAEAAKPVGPSRRRPVLYLTVFAFLAGVGLVLLRNMMRRGIEDADELEALGLSLFATVEKVKGLDRLRAGNPKYAVMKSLPQSLSAEAIRGLRTGLQFSLSAALNKCVMITSCAPGDGKSFISLNLGLATAEAKARVLLIDCDMRRGELAKHFGQTRASPGLSDYLSGKSKFAEVIVRDDDTGLEFIGTGQYPPNPSELLATPRFSDLLDRLQDHYDLILLDCPPALAVTDPGIVGQNAGISLLVVAHLKTTQPEVLAAIKKLANTGVRLSGVIMNQFDKKRSRYGSYGSGYGYYSAGYSYES